MLKTHRGVASFAFALIYISLAVDMGRFAFASTPDTGLMLGSDGTATFYGGGTDPGAIPPLPPFPGQLDLSTAIVPMFGVALDWTVELHRADGSLYLYSAPSLVPPLPANWGQQIPNDAQSSWVKIPDLGGYAYWLNMGSLTFIRRFDLTGADLSTVSLKGEWAAAGYPYPLIHPISLKLNGTTLSQSDDLYPSAMTRFAAPPSLFVQGENELSISFYPNFAIGSDSSTFDLDIVRVAALLTAQPTTVPLPAAATLLALGLSFLMLVQKGVTMRKSLKPFIGILWAPMSYEHKINCSSPERGAVRPDSSAPTA